MPDLFANLFIGLEKKTALAETARPENESCEESEIESDPDTAVPNVGLKRAFKTKSISRAKRLRLVKPPIPKNEKSGQLVKPEEVKCLNLI